MSSLLAPSGRARALLDVYGGARALLAAAGRARPFRAAGQRGARAGSLNRGEEGSTTVEFALGLPSLIVVLAFALSAVAWALDLESAQRGAAEGARTAIVESDSTAIDVAKRTSGEVDVSIARSGDFVTACVNVARSPWPRVARCATARDRS